MPDIFLSYSRADQATARRFAEGFEREGLSVWWDQSLNPGEAYDHETEKALREARAVVVLWSKQSVDSRWVRAEATQADRNKTLVPVMIEPCVRPIMFELTHTADLAHWKGDSGDKAWQSYVAGVRRFVEKDDPVPVSPSAMPGKRVFAPWLTAIPVLLLIAGFVWWLLARVPDEQAKVQATAAITPAPIGVPQAAATGVTLAVLPFANLSSDLEQEYFSDGLTEELLNQLAQIKALRVTGRTSSFSFKGKNEDLRAIGDKLGVDNLLEGSVRKEGSRLRITAQLISSKDGAHLWSKTYDRELSGVFALQEEIAKDVAMALIITLDVGDLPRSRGGTTSVEAYDRFLRGQELVRQGDSAQAAVFYREALSIDPDFARAWSRLYPALLGLLIFDPRDTAAVRRELTVASERTLTLAPDAWWARVPLIEQLKGQRKWSEAEAEAEGLLARTSDVEATITYAFFLWAVGRLEEALLYRERAARLEPLASSMSNHLQLTLDSLGRYGEAQAEYLRSRTLEGDNPYSEWFALRRMWLTGSADPAALERLVRTVSRSSGAVWILSDTLPGKAISSEAARREIHQEFERAGNQNATRMQVIAFYADHHGDLDLALAALRRSVVDMNSTINLSLWFPYETGLRTDPRFKDIVRDIGLVDYWRKSGKWADFCKPIGELDFECR